MYCQGYSISPSASISKSKYPNLTMAGIKEMILNQSSDLRDELVRLRRYLHRNPELSYLENNTSAFICDWLEKQGIPYRKGIAGTGIIGMIRGEGNGRRVIGLRAELDALPVTEKNQCDYASVNTGVMHACGHDAHMSMLMGAATLIKKNPALFDGTVLLVFQPGEEKTPGGAKLMIDSGELNDPRPDIMIAQHVLPELEAGKTGYKAGRYMASSDEIYITVEGTGGHAALPGLTTDQIYIASHLVVRLKDGMKKRQAEVNIPTVLGIGWISGEGATNVIPEKVEIAGTFRTFDEAWRKEALELIGKIAGETAGEFGVKITVKVEKGYPVLVNDEGLTARALDLSRELLGDDRTETFDLRMSSDDFAFYSSLAPSLYYRVGVRKKDGPMRKLHTPDFDLEEDGMVTGVANLSWLVHNFLKDKDQH
jgi:amidohydrolase